VTSAIFVSCGFAIGWLISEVLIRMRSK